jgi:hypothetical protein
MTYYVLISVSVLNYKPATAQFFMVSSYCWKSVILETSGKTEFGEFLFPVSVCKAVTVTAVTRSVTAAQSRQLIPGSKRPVRKFPRPEKQRHPFFCMPDKRMASERG